MRLSRIIAIVAGAVLMAGLLQAQPDRHEKLTVVQREGSTVVVEMSGATRVLDLSGKDLPPEYWALIHAQEGAVIRDGIVDEASRDAALQRVRDLQKKLSR